MDKRLAIGGLAAALVTTTVATSAAAVTSHDPQGRGTARTEAAAATTISCDGVKLRSMKSRIGNSPFTFAETGVNDQDQAVPGTGLAMRGPARGSDTVLVTGDGCERLTRVDDDLGTLLIAGWKPRARLRGAMIRRAMGMGRKAAPADVPAPPRPAGADTEAGCRTA